MVKIFGLAFIAMSLIGCIKPFKPDPAELLAVKQEARTVPNCAGCHNYPLHDVNHQFHLFSRNVGESIKSVPFPYERKSGVPVCMDCHFGSVASHPYEWKDTIWAEPDSTPILDDQRTPSSIVLQVGIIPGFLPLPWGWDGEAINDERVQFMLDSTAKIGQLVQWMTSKKHMNKKVDIEFSSSIVPDSAQRQAAYNPKDFSCSNIECHGYKKKVYRWAAPSKGLVFCPTETHSPAVDSSCRYSPDQE